MSDTINRQDAIKTLHDEIVRRRIDEDTNDDGALDEFDIEAILRRLPSAERWILCSERLPEKSGRYLVTRGLNACDAVWNRVYIINYSDLMGLKSERIWWDGNVGKSDFKRIDDVTAWMPLPEPYEPQESEG